MNSVFAPTRAIKAILLKEKDQPASLPDGKLLALFEQDPETAWHLFTHKYAGLVFSTLQKMGFDYDEAMDRFVYVFEKLSEQNYRRLKSIRYEGSYGDLSPWLRTVVQNFSISWLRSIEGRKRLLKPIAKLSRIDQRVFELYFWKGRSPSTISEELELEQMHADLATVLDCLERIFSVLTQNNRWRLMSHIAKISRTVRIDETGDETGTTWHPPAEDANPEQILLQKEMRNRMADAMKGLPAEDQLLIQLRYVEGATLKQLSAVFRIDEKVVQQRVKSLVSVLQKKLNS